MINEREEEVDLYKILSLPKRRSLSWGEHQGNKGGNVWENVFKISLG